MDLSPPLLPGGGDFGAHGGPLPAPSLDWLRYDHLCLQLPEVPVLVQGKSVCFCPPKMALYGYGCILWELEAELKEAACIFCGCSWLLRN